MRAVRARQEAFHRKTWKLEPLSRCSKLFYTFSWRYFHIESTLSGASVSFVLSHIARYAPSPEENSCIPTTHFQCKNNFEHLLSSKEFRNFATQTATQNESDAPASTGIRYQTGPVWGKASKRRYIYISTTMNTNNEKKAAEVYAQGMTNIYDEVNTSVASAIKQDLVNHFGKGLYYRLKSGEKNINPEQQAFIAETFEKHGVSTPPVYDKILN